MLRMRKANAKSRKTNHPPENTKALKKEQNKWSCHLAIYDFSISQAHVGTDADPLAPNSAAQVLPKWPHPHLCRIQNLIFFKKKKKRPGLSEKCPFSFRRRPCLLLQDLQEIDVCLGGRCAGLAPGPLQRRQAPKPPSKKTICTCG